MGEARDIAVGEARGIAAGKRESVLRIGTKRFGDPDAQTLAILDQIESLDRLDGLVIRAIEAGSWGELLGN